MDAWERFEDEPNFWFQRFVLFCRLGWGRSLYSAYLTDRATREVDGKPASGTPGAWRKNAKRWNWTERAEAWDAYQAKLADRGLDEMKQSLLLAGNPAAQRLAEIVAGDDVEQARLAANGILTKLLGFYGPDDSEGEVTPITIIEVG